ncbi:MAG: hypothetical protein MRK01_13725 [Candidatus Scalindua sp.]|nr:hypothetical protein [Candidatus Scalindua sp.]
MISVNRRFYYGANIALMILLAISMTGCPTCQFGREIVIPSSDRTDPTITMAFLLPDGNTVSVTPGSTITRVAVPGGGTVLVSATAQDDEGVRDAQIWAASITWTTDPIAGITTVSGPGLLGRPTASSRDSDGPGQVGCTSRVALQSLEVRKTSRGGVSYEVHASGVNFGGRTVSTPSVKLEAQ